MKTNVRWLVAFLLVACALPEETPVSTCEAEFDAMSRRADELSDARERLRDVLVADLPLIDTLDAERAFADAYSAFKASVSVHSRCVARREET